MVGHARDQKVEVLLNPSTQTIASGATSYGYIDCLGWNHLKVTWINATEASSSTAAITLSILEGTNSTAASAITALTGGDSSATEGFIIPLYSTRTDGGGAIVFDIDLRKRERYLRIQCTPSTPTVFAAIALLSRGEQVPGSDDGSADLHVIV